MNTVKDIFLAGILYPLGVFGVFWIANHVMGYHFDEAVILPIAFGLFAGHSIRSVWQERVNRTNPPAPPQN